MSTQATTIHDYLVTKCATLWSTKQRLFNPYDIEVNNELHLRNGFAIGFGAFEEVDVIGCCSKISQDFLITVSKKFYALEHDEEKRMTTEKALIEEAHALIKNIAADPKLGGAASKTAFRGSTGIQQVFQESQPFIFVTMTYNAEFTETL